MTDRRAPDNARASRPRRPRRLGRWLRALLFVAGTLCLIIGFSLWLVTRSWFIIARVTPEIERRLGADVVIQHAVYEGNGRLLFRNVSLLARGVPGPAARLCHVGRIEVEVDMRALLTGRIKLEDVALDDVAVRISESSRAAGSFNFMALKPNWPAGPMSPENLPPEVRINRAQIEVGVHAGDQFTTHGTRTLTGSLVPADKPDGWFDLRLIEVNERGEPVEDGGILVSGQWNVLTGETEFHLDSVQLDERAYAVCPQIARLWWDKMDLTGRVGSVNVDWAGRRASPDDLVVSFDVEEVGLTLPIETEELWARYRGGEVVATQSQPRMRVRKGAIRLTPRTFSLDDLEGELVATEDASGPSVGVPYRVNLEIRDIPPLVWSDRTRWMNDVLERSPFTMEFNLEQFRVPEHLGGEAPTLELPLAVARVLEKFRLTGWSLRSQIELDRSAPKPDAEGRVGAPEVQTTGKAWIADASGTYERFPYPLQNVAAYLEFDNDRLAVRYLTGEGSGDARVRLGGSITPPSLYGAIDLRLTANDIPLDDRLRGALNETQREIFDSLLHHDSVEALRASGLLIDEQAIEAAKRRRSELAAERDALAPDAPDGAGGNQARRIELDDEIARLETIIDAGPFKLGGTIDFDLTISREYGQEKPTTLTGRVDVHDVGVVFDRFPYPVFVPGGTFELLEDRVVAGEYEGEPGLPIVTAGGGRGRLLGEISFAREGDEVVTRPDLTLRVENDATSELLYAVIPPTERDASDGSDELRWPGRSRSTVAQWLEDLDMEGVLAYEARIVTDASGDVDYKIDVDLDRGSASPAEVVGRLAGGPDAHDPADWKLENCRARLTILRDAIELAEFTADHPHGEIDADGRIDIRDDEFDLQVDVALNDVEFGTYLLDLLPPTQRATATRLWSRYRPDGTFDAEVHYRRRGEESDPVSLVVRPRDLTLRINDGETIVLTRDRGVIRVSTDRLEFDDLALGLRDAGQRDGLLEFDGALNWSNASSVERVSLEGKWHNALFESPIIPELLYQFGAERLFEHYATLEPSGEFEAEFQLHSGAAGERLQYLMKLVPKRLAMRLDGVPVALDLDPESELELTPGRIDIRSLRGEHDGGRFAIDGSVEVGDPLRASLDLRYDGRLMSPQILAFLPSEVGEALNAIELQEGGASSLSDGRLELIRRTPADAGPGWDVMFDGRIAIRDASMEAGLRFSEVSGPMSIRFEKLRETTPSLTIDARPLEARALGQRLQEVDTRIMLSEDAQRVVIPRFRATAGHGVVSANASIGLGDAADYEVSARMAGVPLSDFLVEPVGEEAHETQEAEVDRSERPSGELYGSLTLIGRRGDPASRLGRGNGRVLYGRLASVPLAWQMLQLLQLTMPGDGLDYGETEFFIAGDTVYFERILFEDTIATAAALQLFGTGEMDLDSFQLDTRFRARSGVAIVREVVGAIGDQLAVIEVDGPLWDPDARLSPRASVLMPGVSGVAPPPASEGRDDLIRQRGAANGQGSVSSTASAAEKGRGDP
jgi:hypothetical protein